MTNKRRAAELKRLEPLLIKAGRADQAFFERRPDRRFRIRRAHSAEVRRAEIEGGRSLALTPGSAWYAVVHHVGGGIVVGVLTVNSDRAEVDFSDHAAELLFRFETEGLDLPAEERLAWLLAVMVS